MNDTLMKGGIRDAVTTTGNHKKGLMNSIENNKDDIMEAATPSKTRRGPLSSSLSTTHHTTSRQRQRRQSSSSSWLSLFWICIVTLVPFGIFMISWHVGMVGGGSDSRQTTFWSDMPANAVVLMQFLHDNKNNNGSSIGNSSAATVRLSPLQQQQQQKQQKTLPPSYNGQNNNNTLLLLALLYPPGLMGGYRNQVIRFTSLCVHAATQQRKRDLFLPSLLWVTQVQEEEKSIVNNNSSSIVQQQHTNNAWLPVPMQDIFDIEHWNSIASQNNNPLPRIISLQESSKHGLKTAIISNHEFTMSNNAPSLALEKCWIFHNPNDDDESMNHRHYPHALQRAVWNRPGAGYLRGLYNETLVMIETFHRPTGFVPRRTDFLPAVEQQCQGPILTVYGGGKMGGRLWTEAMSRRKRLEKQQLASSTKKQNGTNDDMTSRFSRLLLPDDEETATTPTTMDGWVVRALQPAPIWRAVADQCLVIMDHDHNNNDTTNNERHDEYLALHARIELEMMSHRCGATMEFNLTKILSQVQDLVEWTIPATIASSLHDDAVTMIRPYGNVSGILIAVSREGMDPSKGGTRFHDLAQDNLETLNRLVNNNHRRQQSKGGQEELLPRVFECGEKVLRNYYAQHVNVPDYGSLLQGVVNFHLAVHAKVFVGVQRSSYSTDVWTTRYYLGKGRHNYRYTKNGYIVPVENDGLPKPHIDCAVTSDKDVAVNVMNLPIRS